MKTSNLQLDEFFLTRLQLNWCSGKHQDDVPYKLVFDYELGRHNDEPKRFRLTLQVSMQVDQGYRGLSIDAEILGFFSFPADTEENDMQYLVRVNGATILYGLLRGQVAMVSGSFPHGKLNMPPVIMCDVLREVDRLKAEETSNSEIAQDQSDH